ncbi:MAG: hypothetical protein C5B47_03255 [Verrucomicrobia bacterium]|nr:MAG: hypothetical protein C5B47_03255 [Verrucomicrobiota bacterium]
MENVGLTLQQLSGTATRESPPRPVKWATSLGKVDHPKTKNFLKGTDELRYLKDTDQEKFKTALSKNYLRLMREIGHHYENTTLSNRDSTNLKEAAQFLHEQRGEFEKLQRGELDADIAEHEEELSQINSRAQRELSQT